MIKRLCIYVAGIFFVSLGIVLCVKCQLGVSPISSLPYVLEIILPLTFGQLTMLYHLLNIGLQLYLRKKIWDAKIWLQIPVAIIFGQLIDFLKDFIKFSSTDLQYQLIVLALSIIFTAFGMVCMLEADLIQNPPDGTVKMLSANSGKELGKVKIVYDITIAVISCFIGFLWLGKPEGLGIGTIASAIFVGRFIIVIKKFWSRTHFSYIDVS